jgi:adenosylcobinamide kinase/adenosylcobinamide-phosphate guanylyltransferase
MLLRLQRKADAQKIGGCGIDAAGWTLRPVTWETEMGHVLVLGGARSGKTGFAERLAMRSGSRPAYLATAQALDEEMRERVRTHKQQRGGAFATFEEPLDLSATLVTAARSHDVILVDCLTLWITNMIVANQNVAEAVEDLGATLQGISDTRVILVSNEVGLGIVPDNAMARMFRDLAGAAHQRLAEICDDVYFVAAGLHMVMKGDSPDATPRRVQA